MRAATYLLAFWRLLMGCLSAELSLESYSSIVSSIKSRVTNDKYNIFDVVYGEEAFSNLDQNMCSNDAGGADVCRYMLLRVTNFNKTGEEVNSLPQLLVVGGLDGAERVGAAAVLAFMKDLESSFPRYKSILNQLQVLLVPVANPFGYSRSETQERGAVPSNDFPFMFSTAPTDTKCFTSSSSRFLNEIFRNYLISTAVFIGPSSTSVTKLCKPRLTQHFPS